MKEVTLIAMLEILNIVLNSQYAMIGQQNITTRVIYKYTLFKVPVSLFNTTSLELNFSHHRESPFSLLIL